MMMSVFRQGRTRSEIDHLACIDLAATSEDIELITFSYLNEKPALVGLTGGTAVVKPQEAGDEALSFDTLYDTALTAHEFARLQRHGVKSPEDLGDRLYETEIVMEVSFHPRAVIRLRAKDETAARAKLHALMQPGQVFLQRLCEEFCQQIVNSDYTSISSAGWLGVCDPAPASVPEWDFGPFDDGEPDAKAEHQPD
jgi:hypothetical protein